jgi:hypothetical protein
VHARRVSRLALRALALAALLALSGCAWDVDPLASLGASLKKVCRSSDSCSSHDAAPGRY